VIVGFVILLWGGVFWTDRDKVVDAGPLEITTAHREGVSLPPLLGGAIAVVGAVLVLLPRRTPA
jgi:hypothetical protein